MNDDRVNDLRQQLRALGYLDAGVDRFLLAPAGGSRGPIALAARASTRVGLLAGALLGPAAAIGVGARLPGLVSGVRDAIVIAIYLAVFFFLAITATSFIVTLVSTMVARTADERFRRRASLVSRTAGWVTSLACLLYLTLWWRNANAGFGWSAPVWTAFALFVAVAISLLLGHAQRITTLAVLASAAGPSVMLPASAGRSWRVVLAGGALAFAGAAALLISTAGVERTEAAAHPPLTVVSTGRRVTLLALDGFDPAIYEQLRDSLPNLKLVLGGRQLRLTPQDTTDPARAWTTIATGVAPEIHGVHAIETRRVAGLRGAFTRDSAVGGLVATATDLVRLTRPSIAGRDERKAKTVWEVAEEAGLRTAVVNWWATWPAPASGGVVVTDRAVLRLQHGGALDGEIAPAQLYDRLHRDWPQIAQQSRAAATAAFPGGDDTATVLRRSAELDATIVRIAEHVSSDALDLFVVYLPGLDIAQNALLGAAAGTLSPSEITGRVDALRSYYPYLDRLIGSLVEARDKQDLLVVTQPGRVRTSIGGLFAWAPMRDRLVGELAVINTPANVESAVAATPLDVAPTIWWRLGVPLSRELQGVAQPRLVGISSEITNGQTVPTYGRPSIDVTPRRGAPLDREAIDRLRSLGYIK